MVGSFSPYSSALFDLAKEVNKEDYYLEQLEVLAKIWNENEDFKNALRHPKITKLQKTEWISNLFEKDMDALLYRYLLVMIEHDMIGYIPEIKDAYQECLKEDRNIETVLVESAIELDKKQIMDLKTLLETKLNKTIELEIKVKPELMAGMRVHTKDLALDNSLLSKLNGLKEKLINMD